MTPNLNRLRLNQTERTLASFEALKGQPAPQDGWLRAVRESLGRSLRVQAARLGIAAPTLHKSESAEAEGRITLAQLRKLAAGLDCEVVYALIPRQSLSATVEAQADILARQEVLGVTHSMSLEDQKPSDQFVARQVAERRQALLAGPWSKLWR
jgi:predicted DNA-binding mobile mystery protein A